MTAYTSLDLLTSVKQRAMIPDASSGSLSSATLLIFASEELQGPIMQAITAVREGYYRTSSDQNITANVATYAINARASSGVVSVVQYVYNQAISPLPPIDPRQVNTTVTSLTPLGFYFQNNNIVLHPIPAQTAGVLRQHYFQRPSRVEQTVNCAQITAIDTNAITVTVSSIPSAWTTGTIVDFIPQTVPYTPYSLDITLAGVTSTTITLSAIPTGCVVGDWIALAGFTPIPEVPYEWFQVLAQATACKALEATGDPKLPIAQQMLKAYIDSATKGLTPRDQTGPKKVVSGWRDW